MISGPSFSFAFISSGAFGREGPVFNLMICLVARSFAEERKSHERFGQVTGLF